MLRAYACYRTLKNLNSLTCPLTRKVPEKLCVRLIVSLEIPTAYFDILSLRRVSHASQSLLAVGSGQDQATKLSQDESNSSIAELEDDNYTLLCKVLVLLPALRK
jgi:hypothetical protein